MVNKGHISLYSSRVSDPDCMLEVVPKSFVPEFSYILFKLFSMCLTETCFPDFWKASSVVPEFENVGKKSMTKNHCAFRHHFVASKVYKKLVNNRLVYHL